MSVPTGQYKLVSVLDSDFYLTMNDINVTLEWKAKPGCDENQKWNLTQLTGSQYSVRNESTKKYLGVDELQIGGVVQGTAVALAWQIEESNSIYAFGAVNSSGNGIMTTVQSPREGSPLDLQQRLSAANEQQYWALETTGED